MDEQGLPPASTSSATLDLRSRLLILRRYAWFTVLVLAVAIGATYFLTQRQDRVYSSSARVVLRTNATASLFPFASTGPHTLLRVGETEQLYAQSPEFTMLLRDRTPSGVRVSVRSTGNDLLFTATGGKPEDVAAAASLWAEEYVVERQRDFIAETQSDIEFLETSIQELQEERNAIRVELTALEDRLASTEDQDQYSRLLTQKVAIESSLQPRLAPIDRQIDDFARDLSSLELITRFIGEPEVSARVSQLARVPTNPISPNTTRNLAVGTLMGVVLGLGLPFVWRAVGDKVGDGDEASVATGLAVVGSVPLYKRDGETSIEVLDRPTSVASESYQAVLTAIEFGSRTSPISSVLFTSASPGEGKTTTALNVAALAAKYMNVVLVDGDLRRPNVHVLVGEDNDVGLSDVLAGDVDVFDARKTVKRNGTSFDVLLAGPVSNDPTVLLRGQAWSKLLGELFLYDLIVIDAPPVLPVTDALLLGAAADGQVLVSRSGSTTRADLAEATSLLATNGGRTLGVVVNLEQSKSKRYEYYGEYGPRDGGSVKR